MSQEVIFDIKPKAKLDEKQAERIDYLREQLATAESLGLDQQAAVVKRDIITLERGGLIATPPLTDAEVEIWRAWLPTTYNESGDGGWRTRKLSTYNFDRIPAPVLRCWQKHKESNMFDRFEIWTPQRDMPDPILVGINGNAHHLLARWGESDANLTSFDDIKRAVIRRWRLESSFEPAGISCFVAFVAATVAFMVAVLGVEIMDIRRDIGASALFGVLGVVGFGAFCVNFFRMWRRERAHSTLMRAIDKDNAARNTLPASS